LGTRIFQKPPGNTSTAGQIHL